MPLLVKPNARKAREFWNTPSVGKIAGRGISYRATSLSATLPRLSPAVTVGIVLLVGALLAVFYAA